MNQKSLAVGAGNGRQARRRKLGGARRVWGPRTPTGHGPRDTRGCCPVNQPQPLSK